METEQRQEPESLPDESLDEASGGLTFNGQTQPSNVSITDGTSKASFPGFSGGVTVAAGDVNNDAAVLKIADGSVKGV